MLYTTIFMCSVIGIEPHGKGGCMALHTNDDVSILYNNISGSVALNKDGCADIATGNINIRYTVVDQCFSNNGCGGLHFTDCFFTIKFSVFVLLASQMKVNDIGVSLHADNPQKNCSISYCSIFRRENTNFYTIHMDNSANRISISNCCFTGGKNQEINESRVIEKDNIFWATSCMTYVMFYLPKEMGYKNNKEIQKVQKKNTIDELFGSQAERFLSTLAVPLTIVGCVLGVILYVAFGFLGLFPMPSRRRNRPTTTRRNRNSTQI